MPTPEEVLAEFTRMQQEKAKAGAENFFAPDTTDAFVAREDSESRGPENPLEVEPATHEDTIPAVPSTGSALPLVNKLNVEDKRGRIPENFLASVALILKDSGADSMSQEKALARINELIEYPKPEVGFIDNPGVPVEELVPSNPKPTLVISSDVPGHPNPE